MGLGEDRSNDGGELSVLGIDSNPGLLPRVLQQLVHKRRQVKMAAEKERDPARKASLHAKQLALKLTANSIYGCLGFSGSRFYAKPLAAFITQQGRALLMAAKDKVEQQMRLSVLYGDTDSIMVQTPNSCSASGAPRHSVNFRRYCSCGCRRPALAPTFASCSVHVSFRHKRIVLVTLCASLHYTHTCKSTHAIS